MWLYNLVCVGPGNLKDKFSRKMAHLLQEGLAILKEEGVDICLASLLHVAVKYDQVSVAECLLESGADANAKDKK